MGRLSISLLGPFQVELDGQPVKGFKSNKVRGLLAYLAVEGDRPHRRERLAGLLWPDWPNRDALSNLRYALSNLRTVIGDHISTPPFLLITRDSLGFNQASDHWLDVANFTRAIENLKSNQLDLDRLESAVALYRGGFLEGFYVADSPAFEEWSLYTRERLTRQALSALHELTEIYEGRDEYERAQFYARRHLELEPWDESAHQQLMRSLALCGQRSAALAQYESCRSLLAKELDIEPSEQTKKLYERIRADKLKPLLPSPAAPLAIKSALPEFLIAEAPDIEPPIFVSRTRELAQLDRFLEAALGGQGRVVFVIGEAGSGKTSLLQEFIRRAQNANADLCVSGGNCNAYTGIGDPYLPFREILTLLTGDVEARLAAAAITREQACRLWNLIPSAIQALVEVGPALIDTFIPRSALLERAVTSASGQAEWLNRLDELLERKPAILLSSPGMQQYDLFEQYTKMLQTLAQQRPLLLVLDDLQWADLGSISLLFHLGRCLTGNRVLIIGAYRSEEIAIGKDGDRHALEPVVNEFRRLYGDIIVNVDMAESQEFVETILDSEPNQLGLSFRKMLFRQTRGNPLFTIELLRAMQERGNLVHDREGRWVEYKSLDWETLPVRVEAAIRERIDRLPGALRQALSVASVEGEDFTAEVVAQVLGMDEREMVHHLSDDLVRRHRLVSAHAIERLGSRCISRYRFRHILFQRYLYSSLDEVERVYLHEQVGNALEEMYKSHEEIIAIAVRLAMHFQKAKISVKAIHYLHQAGERAVQMSAYLEGRVHLNRGLALLMILPDSPERAQLELALQISLGRAWIGEIPSHEREIANARARQLCRQTGNTTQKCMVLNEQSIYHYVRGEHKKARELSEEVLSLAEQAEDPLLIALSHWCLGLILFTIGEYASAHAHLEKTISSYDPGQHHHSFVSLRGSDGGVSALAYDACCLWCLGYPEQAQELSQKALYLARELDHAFSLADVLCYGGCLINMMSGATQDLQNYVQELSKLSKKMGFSSFGMMGTCFMGVAQARLGQVQEGIALLQQGLAARESIYARCNIPVLLVALAEAQAWAGQPKEGLATLVKALALVEDTDERNYEAEMNRIKAGLLSALRDRAGAEASLYKAIEVARRQDAKLWELRAVLDLGRLWQSMGRKEEAHQMLSEIYHWFTEGFDTPDLIKARRLLEELVMADP